PECSMCALLLPPVHCLRARGLRSSSRHRPSTAFCVFSFNAPATAELYTLSLHDALPICHEDLRASWISRATRYTPPTTTVTTPTDRKSTRLNSSHVKISYAVFCLKKKKKDRPRPSYNKGSPMEMS